MPIKNVVLFFLVLESGQSENEEEAGKSAAEMRTHGT
jgi:hypothetical protein